MVAQEQPSATQEIHKRREDSDSAALQQFTVSIDLLQAMPPDRWKRSTRLSSNVQK